MGKFDGYLICSDFDGTIYIDGQISNKNIEPTQQIVYYYSKDINNESIEKCVKYPTEFPFYSRYNYEMLNTLLYYKAGDVRGFLYAMFPTICGCLRKRKRISRSKILSHYYQKLYEEVSLKKQITNTNSERSNNTNDENIDSSLDMKNIYIKDDSVQTNDNMFYIFKADNLTLFFVYNILFTVDAYIVKATAHKFKCLGISPDKAAALIPMCHGQLLVVVLARVNLRRRQLVTHALNGKLIGHYGMLCTVIVLPIFDMMTVSALVVKPRLAVSDILAAGTDGRAIAPEIFYTLKKLDGGKF